MREQDIKLMKHAMRLCEEVRKELESTSDFKNALKVQGIEIGIERVLKYHMDNQESDDND